MNHNANLKARVTALEDLALEQSQENAKLRAELNEVGQDRSNAMKTITRKNETIKALLAEIDRLQEIEAKYNNLMTVLNAA